MQAVNFITRLLYPTPTHINTPRLQQKFRVHQSVAEDNQFECDFPQTLYFQQKIQAKLEYRR